MSFCRLLGLAAGMRFGVESLLFGPNLRARSRRRQGEGSQSCNEAGVAIKTAKYTGKDPLAYVLSANLHRRHLNESQRSMIAAKLATKPSHRPGKSAENTALSQPDAAALLHVDRSTVQHAKKVLDKGIPELIVRVEIGEIAVSNAAKVQGDRPFVVERPSLSIFVRLLLPSAFFAAISAASRSVQFCGQGSPSSPCFARSSISICN